MVQQKKLIFKKQNLILPEMFKESNLSRWIAPETLPKEPIISLELTPVREGERFVRISCLQSASRAVRRVVFFGPVVTYFGFSPGNITVRPGISITAAIPFKTMIRAEEDTGTLSEGVKSEIAKQTKGSSDQLLTAKKIEDMLQSIRDVDQVIQDCRRIAHHVPLIDPLNSQCLILYADDEYKRLCFKSINIISTKMFRGYNLAAWLDLPKGFKAPFRVFLTEKENKQVVMVECMKIINEREVKRITITGEILRWWGLDDLFGVLHIWPGWCFYAEKTFHSVVRVNPKTKHMDGATLGEAHELACPTINI